MFCCLRLRFILFYFKCMHFIDAFIQSHLALKQFLSVLACLGNRTCCISAVSAILCYLSYKIWFCFTWMHLEDAFIQSDLALKYIFISSCLPWDLNLWPWHCYFASILDLCFTVGHLVLVMYYILSFYLLITLMKWNTRTTVLKLNIFYDYKPINW